MSKLTPTENIDRHITAVLAMETATGMKHTASQVVAHVCRQMLVDGYEEPEESAVREQLSRARANKQ